MGHESQELEDDQPGQVPRGGLGPPAFEKVAAGAMTRIAAIGGDRQHHRIDHEHP